ncbi:MAG TPA: PTS sugar transporter subunit IIA [Phycisphaerales bacterium]|nr:PTS sugar transporter subunit IIA [Phycisphaerales bacterium]
MRLSDIICFDAIVPQLAATDRNAAIEELILSLHKKKKLGKADPTALTRAVIRRENEASTGIGKGVAVPHVKHADVARLVAVVGCSATGIDFSSLDKQPVYTIFLLLSPTTNPDKHLQAMETIFRNLQNDDFRRFLRQSQSAQDIIEAIKDSDGDLSE